MVVLELDLVAGCWTEPRAAAQLELGLVPVTHIVFDGCAVGHDRQICQNGKLSILKPSSIF
jgi:hypothetical protein